MRKVRIANVEERCAVCGCKLHRTPNTYARHTVEGRSHATKHHNVAERFFGRSANRRGTLTGEMFSSCPWQCEGKTEVFCYECHEELLHNPVLIPDDILMFAELVRRRGLCEDEKTVSRAPIAGRVALLREVIAHGLEAVFKNMA